MVELIIHVVCIGFVDCRLDVVLRLYGDDVGAFRLLVGSRWWLHLVVFHVLCQAAHPTTAKSQNLPTIKLKRDTTYLPLSGW